MIESPSDERSWFLKDEPLSSFDEHDRFNHDSYVNLLETTIGELTPPFTLGVFGSWGVGKSSIVNSLSNKLEESSSAIRAVTIDVWKYSDNSLRRQFLYDLQEELRSQNGLPKGEDYVGEVYQGTVEERPGGRRFDISRLRDLAVPLVLTFVISAAIFGLSLILGYPDPVRVLLASLVAPAALFLVAEFTRRMVVTVTRPAYFSEDQFERKFAEIVADAKCKKLVIIVDNLDRCSHDLVVETLSSIKTFLEPRGRQKCIFVIPCDDAAIRRHVKAAYRVLGDDPGRDGGQDAEQYAVEYLRKFFSGSIKVDPFLPEEIESYIKHLLNQMRLIEVLPSQNINPLVEMVSFLFTENPRQLKQFLNNLTSKYLLAKEREAGSSPQINPPISGNVLFLAKVVAIEARFPDIYLMFRNDDNLFSEVHSAAITPSRTGETKSLLNGSEASVLLENFLRTTRHITADNPTAFFHLKQSEQEARIPNYSRFYSALRRGDVEEALNAYAREDEETSAARTDILIRHMTNWVHRGYESLALNAIQIAVDLTKTSYTDIPHLSREVTKVMAAAPGLLARIHEIREPSAIFSMAEHAVEDDWHLVQDAYVERFVWELEPHLSEQSTDTELQDSIAHSLVVHVARLTGTQEERLRSALSASNTLRPALLEILSSTEIARSTFIESETLRKVVDSVDSGDLVRFVSSLNGEELYDVRFSVLIRCEELGDRVLADATVQKLLELFEYATNSGNDNLSHYACRVATNLGALLAIANPTHLEGITPHLLQHYPSSREEQQARIVALVCRYYEQATESSRGEIVSTLCNDFIPSMDGDQLSSLVELHRDPTVAGLPWTEISEHIVERLVSEAETAGASDLMLSVLLALVPNDYDFLMVLGVGLTKRHETQSAIALLEQLVDILPGGTRGKNLAAPVFASILSTDENMGDPSNKKLFLEFNFRHRVFHTRGFMVELDDHLVELIVEDGPMQETGCEVLEGAHKREELSGERYIAILHRVAERLLAQSPASPLAPPVLALLSPIVTLTAALPENDSRKTNMVKWLSEKQDESLPLDERQQTLTHLTSFGRLPEEILHDLVFRLVQQAQDSADEPTSETIIESLLNLFRDNSPDNSDLWIDFDNYRRSLMHGDDTEKKLGRRLYRQMRKIRKAAQQ